jgi:hypothetical protein
VIWLFVRRVLFCEHLHDLFNSRLVGAKISNNNTNNSAPKNKKETDGRTDGRTDRPHPPFLIGVGPWRFYISFHVSGTNKRNNNQMLSVYTISIMDAIFARAGKYLPSQTNNSVPAREKKRENSRLRHFSRRKKK